MPRREVECVRQKRAVMQVMPRRSIVVLFSSYRVVAHEPLQCYAANGDNVLECADVVKALVGCSNMLLETSLRRQPQ
jgi:hypothetical protein